MADNTVKLTHSNGVTVRVSKDKVDHLLAMGFTKPTSSKSTSSSNK
jgi:hypothetical protein